MKYYTYAILGAISASAVGVLVKLTNNEIPIMTLPFYRVLFAFIFLLFIIPIIDKNTFKIKNSDLKEYFIIGLLLATAITVFTLANIFAPVQNVFLLANFAPFFTLILAYFWLKEKITKTKLITLLIAILGLLIINPFQKNLYSLGNSLSLLTAFLSAVLITLMRKSDKEHSIGNVLWFFFFALILLLPLPFIFGFGTITNKTFIYLILLGLIGTAFQFLFHNLALENLEAEIVSIISMIFSPLIAILLAFFIVNETLNIRTIIGGIILIIAGIYLEKHLKTKKKHIIHIK